ncbi:SRPBCC family protein [Rhodanobacter sp. L36]|uniref:SRPBCC family protein n=1 Tax=Rhodanobacter sp. L36 TaxID=1747221 RepID=UPI00131D579F|nr:SRPBCC family protein [Rhodanobacter sp. L36]
MNEASIDPPPYEKYPGRRRSYWFALAVGIAYGLGVRLLFGSRMLAGPALGHTGGAMLVSFLFLTPLVVGAITVYLRRDLIGVGGAILGPWLPMLVVLGLSALFNIEGSICIALAAPIFLIVSSVGGLLMLGALAMFKPRPGILSVALLVPLLLGYGERYLRTTDAIRQSDESVHINASPAAIWALINAARAITPSEMDRGLAWRIGVPYPMEAVTVDTPQGRVRKLRWQHGVHFDEPIVAWDENRFIQWHYRFAADSIPAGALDEHVRVGGQYFDLLDTSYTLDPEAGGTRLDIHVTYRVSTHFNWYAGGLARVLVDDSARTILDFYKRRSERSAVMSDAPVASR